MLLRFLSTSTSLSSTIFIKLLRFPTNLFIRCSKLILILDVNQTYGANRGFEGFKKLLPNCKGNKFISFIELQHIQRSELTKLVDEIFK
jgi:hypothetical protein